MILLQGLAKLEVEVTNLAAKAGKGNKLYDPYDYLLVKGRGSFCSILNFHLFDLEKNMVCSIHYQGTLIVMESCSIVFPGTGYEIRKSITCCLLYSLAASYHFVV